MSESCTPVKESSKKCSAVPVTIPPSPFLKKLGYGTGNQLCSCLLN